MPPRTMGLFNFRSKKPGDGDAPVAVGDEVVTSGGMLGRITETGDQFLTVEIADGVRVKVQRHTVGTVLPKGTLKNA